MRKSKTDILTYKKEVYMDMIEVFRVSFAYANNIEEKLKIARAITAMLRDF